MLTQKPAKPYDDFPLFPHATKRWAKKIKGKTHYFGPWSDPQAAMARYLAERDDLQAGRVPRAVLNNGNGPAIRDLCNSFLTSKKLLVENNELSARQFADYFGICERLVDTFGRERLVSDLRSEDFDKLRAKLARGTKIKSVGVVTLANLVRLSRIVFKFGFDSDLIDKPVKFGPGFKAPAKKLLRADRHARPLRMLEAEQLRTIITAANPPMKAMVLLGINCGFGNTDCAKLPHTAIDLDGGWITFPRPKTAVLRRCPLWPETVKALRDTLDKRPQPKREEFAGLVFLTKSGRPYVRSGSVGNGIDGLGAEFARLLKRLELNRDRLGFYALRHTFETIAGASRDQIATSAIMGHAPHAGDMASVYRERIDDDRLKAVADHVRHWLWPETITTTATTKTE